MRCVECPTNRPKCRKKLIVNRYFYITKDGSDLSTSDYPDAAAGRFTINNLSTYTLSESDFELNLSNSDMATLDGEGYSVFEVNVIFLTSSG